MVGDIRVSLPDNGSEIDTLIETGEFTEPGVGDPGAQGLRVRESWIQDAEFEFDFDHEILKLKVRLPRLKDFETGIWTVREANRFQEVVTGASAPKRGEDSGDSTVDREGRR